MIGIMHSRVLPLAYKDLISRPIDIASKLPLVVVPGLSVKYGIIEFSQVPTGMPLAPYRSSPDHDIFIERGMIELHLKHHTTSIIVNPGFGSIYCARIALCK